MISPLPIAQPKVNTQKRLSSEAAQRILDELPTWVVSALNRCALDIEYPLEAVVEMAIASFLDDEAIGFSDCLLRRRSRDQQ